MECAAAHISGETDQGHALALSIYKVELETSLKDVVEKIQVLT